MKKHHHHTPQLSISPLLTAHTPGSDGSTAHTFTPKSNTLHPTEVKMQTVIIFYESSAFTSTQQKIPLILAALKAWRVGKNNPQP